MTTCCVVNLGIKPSVKPMFINGIFNVCTKIKAFTKIN